jgi:hypothetical protein
LGRLKRFRHMATLYDTFVAHFIAFVHLADTFFRLRGY